MPLTTVFWNLAKVVALPLRYWIAPQFFDCDASDRFNVPSVLDVKLYRPQMRAGVRIFSQSWGVRDAYKLG